VEKYNKHKNKRINEKQIDDGWIIVNSNKKTEKKVKWKNIISLRIKE